MYMRINLKSVDGVKFQRWKSVDPINVNLKPAFDEAAFMIFNPSLMYFQEM